MATKIAPVNQHEILHQHYLENNCCLCKAEARIKELEQQLSHVKPVTEEMIRGIFDHFIEAGENKLKMMYDKEMADKLSHAIFTLINSGENPKNPELSPKRKE
jgi:uncharacterized coiled-coil protein SlyX